MAEFQATLKEIEENIGCLFKKYPGNVLEEEMNSLKVLEERRKDMLDNDKIAWKMKSMANGMKEGDGNTIFLQLCKLLETSKHYLGD